MLLLVLTQDIRAIELACDSSSVVHEADASSLRTLEDELPISIHVELHLLDHLLALLLVGQILIQTMLWPMVDLTGLNLVINQYVVLDQVPNDRAVGRGSWI